MCPRDSSRFGGSALATDITSILDKYVSTSSSLEDTVRNINGLVPTPKSENDGEIESFLWEFWATLSHVASELTGTTQHLLGHLVGELQQQARGEVVVMVSDRSPLFPLGSLPNADAQVVLIKGRRARLWQDLPVMGPAFLEEFNRNSKFLGA